MKNNFQLRGDLRAAKIPLWRVADALGVSESTIIRRLRHELSPEERKRFSEAVDRIKAEKEVA